MSHSKGYTVERRVLLECRLSSELSNGGLPIPERIGKGGCGKQWFNVTEKVGPADYWGRQTRKLELPRFCPLCNGWNMRLLAQLKVSESSGKGHTCENTCQQSESKSCKCSCGGKMHGAALRMERQPC